MAKPITENQKNRLLEMLIEKATYREIHRELQISSSTVAHYAKRHNLNNEPLYKIDLLKYDWNAINKLRDDGISTTEIWKQFGLTNHAWIKARKAGLTYTQSRKLSTEELFTKCGNELRERIIRRRIRQEKLIPYGCAECGNTGEWNGRALTLQLDHRDGDSSNNELSNFRYLCPNCHTQTPTFGAGNMGNGRTKRREYLRKYRARDRAVDTV